MNSSQKLDHVIAKMANDYRQEARWGTYTVNGTVYRCRLLAEDPATGVALIRCDDLHDELRGASL